MSAKKNLTSAGKSGKRDGSFGGGGERRKLEDEIWCRAKLPGRSKN